MTTADSINVEYLLAALSARGVATSAELQAALGLSQPTVSRLLAAASRDVLTLGRGKRTRYARLRSILGQAAQQPLWWTDEDGRPSRIGQASWLAGDRLHVEIDGIETMSTARLPWFLAPLRAQGFLGRLHALRLARHGLDSDPERWTLEQILFAALDLHDAPGALALGDLGTTAGSLPNPVPADSPGDALDALAADVAATMPAGSSAGGEQPKFTCRTDGGEHLIVKFAPPRGTPFGDRWHELLHLEALALAVLQEHGVPVAPARIVETARRSYLLSPRFDRVGASGRRHVVPLDAVHEAFVHGARRHWAATCEALVRQRRLPPPAAGQAQALFDFGQLIGNTDMHFGNLSLCVARADLPRGVFTLAPVYDMLPMRWRPDGASGSIDATPFEPDARAMAGPARGPALAFWHRAAQSGALRPAMRALAAEMARRLAAA